MANVKRASATSKARSTRKASDDASTPTPPPAPARSERVQRNLDWLAQVHGEIDRLSSNERVRVYGVYLSASEVAARLGGLLGMLEHARATFVGVSRIPSVRVVVLRALLARPSGEERERGEVPAKVYLELSGLMEPWHAPFRAAPPWHVAASQIAEGWDPLGLGKVPVVAWQSLLADYLAAPRPVRSRGVRKRGVRDRDDVMFEFLRDHGLTQATTAKNLRDATASASRPRKQTR